MVTVTGVGLGLGLCIPAMCTSPVPGLGSHQATAILISLFLPFQVVLTPVWASVSAVAVGIDFGRWVFRGSCGLPKGASAPPFSKTLHGWLLLSLFSYSQTYCLKTIL